MDQNMYMTTGELASIMGITKETLFHYDEIGLFCPALVTANGYRYYEVGQLELLDTILLLKELGMPLKEIRELLGNRNPQKMIAVFEERERRIREEMTKLKNMKRWVAHRKERIQMGLKIQPDCIQVQEIPERYYIYSSVEKGNEGDSCKKANELVTRFLSDNPGFKNDYEIAYIQHEEDIRQEIYDRYDNAILLLEKRPQKLSYQILPAGKYLTVYHAGHWKEIGEAYRRLLSYSSEHQIPIEDQYVERYLLDALSVGDLDSYVTEITVRTAL